MRFLLLTLALLVIADISSAQSFDKRNSLLVESNFIMSLSISYDRIIPIGNKTALMFGGDYLMGIGFGQGSHWLSPEVGLLSFGPKHFLDTGVMYVLDIKQDGEDKESSPGLRLSYRLQGNKGLTLRANANFYFNIDPIFIPTIGLGYTF